MMRGHRVLLDEILAELYGVETRSLVQAVKRDPSRFPQDFMFRLTTQEWIGLRSQFVILKASRGQHRRVQLPGLTPRARSGDTRSQHVTPARPHFLVVAHFMTEWADG